MHPPQHTEKFSVEMLKLFNVYFILYRDNYLDNVFNKFKLLMK